MCAAARPVSSRRTLASVARSLPTAVPNRLARSRRDRAIAGIDNPFLPECRILSMQFRLLRVNAESQRNCGRGRRITALPGVQRLG